MLSIFRELWVFLRVRKKYWLVPIVIMLAVFGGLTVLAEEAREWFDLDADVLARHRRAMTAGERDLFGIEKLNVPRSTIPAVTHVDYTARIQTVHRETNPRYHGLLTAYGQRTGCPVLVNTSFNVRGEPIVCTPEHTFRCFMGTEIGVLAIGNCFLRKEDQDPRLRIDYRDRFAPD
jgi:carbamoyltransferase